jgi:hypothetical protein
VVTDGPIRKVGEPAAIRIEMAKTTAAAAIGSASGCFYVPAILEGDPDAGFVDIERLPGLVTLTSLTDHADPRLVEAMGRLGRGLAAVHAGLRLPPEQTLPMPVGWADWSGDPVFIHGDLTMNNVCWDEPEDRLVIVDWSSAPALGAPVTLADPYFDLAWFCLSAFWRPALARRPAFRVGPLCDTFLAAYAESSGSFSGRRFRALDHEALISAGFGRTQRSLRWRVGQVLRRTRWRLWLRTSRALRDRR